MKTLVKIHGQPILRQVCSKEALLSFALALLVPLQYENIFALFSEQSQLTLIRFEVIYCIRSVGADQFSNNYCIVFNNMFIIIIFE